MRVCVWGGEAGVGAARSGEGKTGSVACLLFGRVVNNLNFGLAGDFFSVEHGYSGVTAIDFGF